MRSFFSFFFLEFWCFDFKFHIPLYKKVAGDQDWKIVEYDDKLRPILLYCTVLYCTVLYCTVVWWADPSIPEGSSYLTHTHRESPGRKTKIPGFANSANLLVMWKGGLGKISDVVDSQMFAIFSWHFVSFIPSRLLMKSFLNEGLGSTKSCLRKFIVRFFFNIRVKKFCPQIIVRI